MSKKPIKMKLDIGYVDSWEIKDAEYVHPSHRNAVIKVKELLDLIEEQSEKGNLVGEKGFSAALFLSELKKILSKC
jgi:hypothetical protein